ncbi:hypothetical protein H1R17_10950 [Flavobacterium sp. xlx-214]|uniref:hypothetical protein n=1 Tax=unclassified Flavobacterium TaxID=196869 RepID=UPI0013D7A7F3|nr:MULTISPECIES: hypothetical protein [unclassified Flavobacterium]MBA5791731.1 hypothetical protein [Flavobacterium sp. xlx-221]QMI82970.1 hypothetical protein H1R17_10950 [Flavobacterium sp. xlx-214]
MKNIPHQFVQIEKFYRALRTVKDLIEEEIPLKDENLGERLLRNQIIFPNTPGQSIEDYLAEQDEKTPANRGYYTAGRETRRFFELLGLLTVADDKSAYLSPSAISILTTESEIIRLSLWRDSILRMGVEGNDGEVSNPYRILLRLVQDNPGLETKKLMLALDAENNSIEEYQRILTLSQLSFDEILANLNITIHKARNAVKILPSLAEQLGDIERRGNNTFPIGQIVITEDEISTEIPTGATNQDGVPYSQFRSVTSETIAIDPIFNTISTVNIDYTESIRIRQQRLAEHQEIVRQLGLFCEERGFSLYEGKFDCLSTLEETALVFEVKTILSSMSDQEKQTIKGVGQLKYYKFSIVNRQMGFEDIKEFLVYSQKPQISLIEFCTTESIKIIWLQDGVFKIYDSETNEDIDFDPLTFL